MSRESRLIKNTLILFVGVIGTRLISFIMLPFYTDWLSVEEYGIIDIFTTIVSMCVPILTLQLEQAVFRFMIDDKTLEDNQSTVTTGIICLAAVLLCIDIPTSIYFAVTKNNLYLLYLLAINLQGGYVMCQQIVRGQGQNHVYTENSMLLAFINLLFSVLFIRFMRLAVVGYILAFCIAHILAIFFMVFKSKIYKIVNVKKFEVAKLKRLLAYSIPMIVNNVSWWILNASDKLVLNYFVGVSANGIYAAAGKLPGLVTTIYTVFQMAWQESASREQGKKLTEFYSNVFRKLFAVISYFVISMLLCGKILFKFLISSKFEDAYYHMPILVVALLFLCISQFYGGIYVGLKKSGELGWTSAVAAVVNLTIDLIFVKTMKIYAASISTLVAYTVLCVIRFFSSKKICKINYRWREIIFTGITLVISFALAYVPGILYQIITLALFTIAYAVLYKDVVMDTVSVFKRKLGH